MEAIRTFLSAFSSLDKTVMVPIVMLILALVFRVKPSLAIKSALLFGAGLAGVTAINNIMTTAMTPVAQGLIENSHMTNDILDIGMSPMFVGVVSLPYFIFLYPIGIGLNLLLISCRWTKTMMVDFLNFATMSIPAVPVYFMTKSIPLTLLVFAVYFAACLKIADWSAHEVQTYYGVDGVSIPHPSAGFQVLYVKPLNWLIDKIPGLNKIDFTLNDIQAKMGVLGSPSVLGFIIGTVLGLIARMGIAASLYTGMSLTATMLLFPKAIGLMMEALTPMSKSIKEQLAKHFKHLDTLYMGMDAAIFAGFPEVVAISSIFIPIVVVLHFILPGVRVLPGAESLQLAIVIGMIVPFAGTKEKRGNVFRTLLIGVIIYIAALYTMTYMAPIVTELATSTGLVESGTIVTSMGARDPQKGIIYLICKALLGQ